MTPRAGVRAAALLAILAVGLGTMPAKAEGRSRNETRGGTQKRTERGLARVEVIATPPVVRKGEVVTVRVRAEGIPGSQAVAFHLVYDPRLLETLPGSFSEGGFLGADGSPTSFLATPASTGERIIVGASRLGRPRHGHPSGLIATFKFRARRTGKTSFHLDQGSVTGPGAAEIPARFVPGHLRIKPARRRGR